MTDELLSSDGRYLFVVESNTGAVGNLRGCGQFHHRRGARHHGDEGHR